MEGSGKYLTILEKHLPATGYLAMQEDPVDSMFTDNILYHGGNYIVYPGITEQGGHILQTILNAAFNKQNRLSKDFIMIVSTAAYALLTLSSEIARKAEHSRFIESFDRRREKIAVPSDTTFSRLANAASFTKAEVDKILKSVGLESLFLNSFIMSLDDPRLDNDGLDSNPLCTRPIVKIDNDYIVALPSSICCAL